MIGIGTGPIYEAGEKNAVAALLYAYESIRREMFYQIHFGANYETGEYGWTTDLEKVKRQIDWQLQELRTDYIDYGFIHCLDADSDWKEYQENGVLDYLLNMKKDGVVRYIGLSSHTPALWNVWICIGDVRRKASAFRL